MIIQELINSLIQLLLFCLIPFVWWLCSARKKKSFFSWIGLKKITIVGNVWITFAITIAVSLAYAFSMNFLLRFMPDGITMAGSAYAGKGAIAIPPVLIFAFIKTALSEEIIFRGFLLKRLKSKFGFVVANTVQALLFGLLHGVPFALATKSICFIYNITRFIWLVSWMVERKTFFRLNTSKLDVTWNFKCNRCNHRSMVMIA